MPRFSWTLVATILLAYLAISCSPAQLVAGMQGLKTYVINQFRDYELYELVDEFEATVGKDLDFYRWFNVPNTCSTATVAQAHRKLAVAFHPEIDAANGARFNLGKRIASMLIDPRTRQLYDRLLAKKVRWRGTVYYCRRYHATCMFVFIILASGCLEYMQAWLHYASEKSKLSKFLQDAIRALEQLPEQHPARRHFGSIYIDLDGEILQCQFKPDQNDILVYNERGQTVRLSERLVRPIFQEHVWWIYASRRVVSYFSRQFFKARHSRKDDKGHVGSYS